MKQPTKKQVDLQRLQTKPDKKAEADRVAGAERVAADAARKAEEDRLAIEAADEEAFRKAEEERIAQGASELACKTEKERQTEASAKKKGSWQRKLTKRLKQNLWLKQRA